MLLLGATGNRFTGTVKDLPESVTWKERNELKRTSQVLLLINGLFSFRQRKEFGLTLQNL